MNKLTRDEKLDIMAEKVKKLGWPKSPNGTEAVGMYIPDGWDTAYFFFHPAMLTSKGRYSRETIDEWIAKKQ